MGGKPNPYRIIAARDQTRSAGGSGAALVLGLVPGGFEPMRLHLLQREDFIVIPVSHSEALLDLSPLQALGLMKL